MIGAREGGGARRPHGSGLRSPDGTGGRLPDGTGRVRGRAAPCVEVDVSVLLDLLEAACAAGSSVPAALGAVGVAADGGRGTDLVQAAGRLSGGARWHEAWADADPALDPLAAALRASWEEGVAPAGALRATAAHLRRERQAVALAAAGRLGVRLVLPLAACHLPAFVLVGLVPVLISVGGATLG